MNTNMLYPSKLMLVGENGNQTELKGTIEIEPQEISCKDTSDIFENTSVTSYSMNITNDNETKLTRKKFVKLLMSKGIQRNGANEIAKYLLNKNGEYTFYDLMMW